MTPLADLQAQFIDAVIAQIRERRVQREHMIGWLYPSVMNSEIEKLQRLRTFLETEFLQEPKVSE